LRQFGCDCVEKAIGGAAFRTMNLERVQLEAEREADDFLLSNWAWVSRLRDYVQEASVVAAALAENRDAIDTKLRGWRSKVREAARSSDSQLVVSRRRRIERDGYETVQEAIGPFVGRIAVSASFDPAAWVQEVESLIPAGCWDTADSAFEVTAGWSTAQRVERVRHLRDAASRTAIVSRKIEEGRQFFTAEALRRLGRWGGDREAALPFTVRMSTGEAVIQYDGKVCQVRLLDGLRVPQFEE
jgi:hypothetical protein